jgi:3-hydroxyacyl-CoA dehydrogenase
MANRIQRVAVLGAGVMGAGIASHLANAGIESLLYDIVPPDAGDDPKARNAFALKGIEGAKKSKPASLYRNDAAALITPCNYDDHADLLASCDWIVEVVVERLDIKEKVFAWVAEHRNPESIVTSNTSGIPLAELVATMPQEMRKWVLVTHFFNPVRYMRLLEIISGPDTDPAVVKTMVDFGERVLGKGIVYAKDTPSFIANRIGTFGMASVFRHMLEMGMKIEEIDAIFGPAMGRPGSAVFRTGDLVGIDTLAHVFGDLYEKATEDERRDWFQLPTFVTRLLEDGRLGQKSGAGFFKKIKVEGKSVILALDPETMEYRPKEKVRFPSIGKARSEDKLARKLQIVVYGEDKASEIAWTVLADSLIYAANRIPEIADDVVNVDHALEWGFGWEVGPFKTWDAIGVEKSVEKMQAEGREVPAWVTEMLAAGRTSFYARDEAGDLTFWQRDGGVAKVPVSENHLFIGDLVAKDNRIDRNPSASLYDMGDGVLLLEFHSKMNALDELINDLYGKALDRLDAGEFEALVVGNDDGRAFSAGANILGVLMAASQKQFDQIEVGVKALQDLFMRAKYCSKPVVTAPHGLVLGGGSELSMHSAATVAHGELYMGQVEAGVGLIPAGGGCKELLMRYLGDAPQGVSYDPNPGVQAVFQMIGLAKVSMSAEEARDLGFLRNTDQVVLDRSALLKKAKAVALGLVQAGYTPPRRRTCKLPGPAGGAAIQLFLDTMHEGKYATDHDLVVGGHLVKVLTGGDIPSGTVRTEQQLLDLEREAFVSLCGEPKTQARMQHMLQTGKPLRN